MEPPAYLIHDIVQRVGAVDGEANKDEIGFGVRQRTEAVVLFLAGGIPQGELYGLAGGRVRRVGDVVLEYGRNIFLPGGRASVSVCLTMDRCGWTLLTSGK